MKKWSFILVMGTCYQLITAFVAMCFWNWFIVLAFNVSPISYFLMLGVVWFVGIVFVKEENEFEKKILYMILEACVPESKQEDLESQLKDMNESLLLHVFPVYVGRLVGISVTFILGLGLHLLIA
jgi:hypothetical protein